MGSRTVEKLITAHHQTEGAGFVVRRPLPTMGLELVDPFLLIDEMGPVVYGPGEAVGAPDHPHRGFETVTYLLDGEFDHEDSKGHRGRLSSGDVQWMTAGSGLVHSEVPSERLRREGGRLHGFQIWVNLPARQKMTPPRYQEIPSSRIPEAKSSDGLAMVRVIAGHALGVRAVIETHTPITYQDWRVQPGASIEQPIDADQNAVAYVFEGALRIAGSKVAEGQMAILGAGDSVRIEGGDGRMLLLAGRPHREPVARYGPFVMNNRAQLLQAMVDYQSGAMGSIER
jgi:quercetin 2,3-dioxygenase